MGHGSSAVAMFLASHMLTWLVQSTALLGLGLLAGRALKRSGPAVLSGIYRTTLAAVLICPAAGAFYSVLGYDGLTFRLPEPGQQEQADVARPSALASPVPARVFEQIDAVPENVRLTQAEPVTVRAEVEPQPAVLAAEPVAPPALPLARRFGLARAVALLLSIWLLGATVMGVRLAVAQKRMSRLRALAIPADPAVEVLCRELAERMHVSAPAVLRSPFLFSPCLDGLRRPAILLPEHAGDNLRETFVHELAHLSRRDGLWNLLRRAGVAALWVQPLLWRLSQRIEAVAEEVCDDFVVQFGADRAGYAGHLLELAGHALPPVAPAGVRMVSLRSMLAQRVVRILDTSRTLSTRAGRRAVLATLAAGLGGTLLAGLLGVVGGDRKAAAQTPTSTSAVKSEPEAKSEPAAKTIRGQVVGPDGAAVAGATVLASNAQLIRNGIGNDRQPERRYQTLRATAGPDGRFEIAFDTPELASAAQVIATAPGYGLGFYLKDQLIRMRQGDQPINGRIVNLEGEPVAGVKIRIGTIFVTGPEQAPNAKPADTPGSTTEKLELDAAPLFPDGVVTDADGRFRIEGLGDGVLADLRLSGPTVVSKRFNVLTRAGGVLTAPPSDLQSRGLADLTTYGADCTIAVEPTRPIEGIVRDAKTNEPIPGAVVTGFQLSGSVLSIEGTVSAETDASGRYRLVGLPKGDRHKLAVYPPLDRPYFITKFLEVPAGPGLEPVKFDIGLKRGMWITGTVTDLVTGRPVRASVDYFPFLTNKHAENYANFRPGVTSIAIKTRYKTDEDGRFRVVGLPGDGVLTAHTDDRGFRVGVGADAIKARNEHGQLLTYDQITPSLYQGVKEISVPEGTESFQSDLALDPGGSVRLRLVDTSHQPVKGAVVSGRFPDGADNGDHGLHNESVARVAGLVPGKPRTVLIQHWERKIGALETIPADGPRDDTEITVTLRPTATLTGRLVDAEGKPAKGGVRVEFVPEAPELFHQIHVSSKELDQEGRFRCELIPVGGRYTVMATNRLVLGLVRRMQPEAFKSFELVKDLRLEAGQVVDFGTFNANDGKRIDEKQAAAPGPRLAPADVPIQGRIVDLEGRPVAGVSVKMGGVQGAKSGNLDAWIDGVKKGEPPWIAHRHLDDDVKLRENIRREATTDQDGRFRFEGLGRERVVGLTIRGDKVAFTTIDVITRKVDPFPARAFPDTHGPGAETIYGADFTFSAVPSRPVEGVVRDAKTREPMPGVAVESWRFAGSDFVDTRVLKTTTDSAGRFRIVGLPRANGNILIAIPNDDQPYFMREASVGDPPGIEQLPLEIELHRGLFITGKITDKATGKPVAEARLHYLPFLENKYVQAFPEFDQNGNVEGFQARYVTKADGTYKLVGMPGRAIVGVAGLGTTPYRSGVGSDEIAGMDEHGNYKTWRNPIWPGKSWPNTLVEINPAPGTETVTVDAQLDPGISVRIKVVDVEGKSVPDASVSGGNRMRAGQATADALFELASFRPDETRSVVVRHEGRKIGKVMRIHAGDDAKGPVVVTLIPLAAIKGRTVDADGNPIGATTIRVDVEPTEGFIQTIANVTCERDGHFTVPNMPAGCDYGLVAETGTMIKQHRVAFGSASVKPGETTDIGNLVFKND